MLFPSVYQLSAAALMPDAIVTVKGRLKRRDEVPELHASEISVPDLAGGPVGPVVISLPVTRCTPPVVEQLKDVLGSHPGVTEVHLRLQSQGSTKLMRLDDGLRVAPTPSLMADLKALLGPACLA
jgi:DNA polymerase III subunit alpha